jgi:hypothetical protein
MEAHMVIVDGVRYRPEDAEQLGVQPNKARDPNPADKAVTKEVESPAVKKPRGKATKK